MEGALSTTARGARLRKCEKGENKEYRGGLGTHRDDYIFEWTQGEETFFKKAVPPHKTQTIRQIKI